jgi:hypothetical protein
MKGDEIPEPHHVVKYAKPTLIHGDQVDGTLFVLREADVGDGLSFNWLERFAGDKAIQLAEVQRVSRITVKSTGRYAELTVGEVLAHVRAEMVPQLRIVEDPLDPEGTHEADPSHSLMLALPHPNDEKAQTIGDMIAQKVIALHQPK